MLVFHGVVHSNIRLEKAIIWQMSVANQLFLYSTDIAPQFIKPGKQTPE